MLRDNVGDAGDTSEDASIGEDEFHHEFKSQNVWTLFSFSFRK